MMNKNILFFPMLMLCCACNQKEESREMANAAVMAAETLVDTMMLKKRTFDQQLVCNGKLKAIARSEIAFQGQGVVTEIFVNNGSKVAKGQLLAVLDKVDKTLQLQKNEKEMERAEISLTDKLISMGYNGIDDNVPGDVMQRAKVTSGYYASQYQLAETQRALANCELRAPFEGRVADMECQPYQTAGKFGKLIDDSFFDVDFSILEAELKSVAVGQKVKVVPFIDQQCELEGKISRINPLVDDKGLVKVSARIRNTSALLMDGMNVRVIVENTITDMFVVPKSAVVERDGYHVIFEVEDSQAVWTYVDILYSNITHHAIGGCKIKETEINEGETVIISENQNLADGTRVKIK